MKKILDHGYLTLIESWGSDERIVEAARMSTNKGFLGWGTALRMDSGAQWEIREFANAVGELIAEAFPRTWGLFKK